MASARLAVVCALVERQGKVLITRCGPAMRNAGQWEFPGGKVEAGESNEEALIREIAEELSIQIMPLEKLAPVLHQYPHILLELRPYRCQWLSGEITLTEHSEYLWIKPQEWQNFDWVEADIPICQALAWAKE